MTCCHCTAAKSDPEPGSLSRSRCDWACCLMWAQSYQGGGDCPSCSRRQLVGGPAQDRMGPQHGSPSSRLLGETQGTPPAAVPTLRALTVPEG